MLGLYSQRDDQMLQGSHLQRPSMAMIKSSRTERKKKMSSNSNALQIALKRCIHLQLVCVGAEGDGEGERDTASD